MGLVSLYRFLRGPPGISESDSTVLPSCVLSSSDPRSLVSGHRWHAGIHESESPVSRCRSLVFTSIRKADHGFPGVFLLSASANLFVIAPPGILKSEPLVSRCSSVLWQFRHDHRDSPVSVSVHTDFQRWYMSHCFRINCRFSVILREFLNVTISGSFATFLASIRIVTANHGSLRLRLWYSPIGFQVVFRVLLKYLIFFTCFFIVFSLDPDSLRQYLRHQPTIWDITPSVSVKHIVKPQGRIDKIILHWSWFVTLSTTGHGSTSSRTRCH